MSRTFKSLVVVIVAIAAVAAASLWMRPRDVIPWRTDFKLAREESARTQKPILIDFKAEWCGPCQEMRRTTWSDSRVEKAMADYVPVQVDVDASPELAAQFRVNGIPHLVVLDPDGHAIKSGGGYLPPDAFLVWLKAKPSDAATLLMLSPLER